MSRRVVRKYLPVTSAPARRRSASASTLRVVSSSESFAPPVPEPGPENEPDPKPEPLGTFCTLNRLRTSSAPASERNFSRLAFRVAARMSAFADPRFRSASRSESRPEPLPLEPGRDEPNPPGGTFSFSFSCTGSASSSVVSSRRSSRFAPEANARTSEASSATTLSSLAIVSFAARSSVPTPRVPSTRIWSRISAASRNAVTDAARSRDNTSPNAAPLKPPPPDPPYVGKMLVATAGLPPRFLTPNRRAGSSETSNRACVARESARDGSATPAYEPNAPNPPTNASAPREPAENTAGVPGDAGERGRVAASVSPGRGAFQRSVVDEAARFGVRSARPGETDRDRAPLGPGEDGDCAREPNRGEKPGEPAPGEPSPTAFRASCRKDSMVFALSVRGDEPPAVVGTAETFDRALGCRLGVTFSRSFTADDAVGSMKDARLPDEARERPDADIATTRARGEPRGARRLCRARAPSETNRRQRSLKINGFYFSMPGPRRARPLACWESSSAARWREMRHGEASCSLATAPSGRRRREWARRVRGCARRGV